MRNILITAFVLGFSSVSFAGNTITDNEKNADKKNINKSIEVGPVACCWSRASSGTYGQNDYNAVRVQACATSDESYQDAQIRACAKADMAAQKALQIAEDTLVKVKP